MEDYSVWPLKTYWLYSIWCVYSHRGTTCSVLSCLEQKKYLFGKRVRKKCFCIEPDGDWVEFTIQFLKYCLKSQLWKVLRGWYPLH